jgi:predicted NAD/FAD-binding protein
VQAALTVRIAIVGSGIAGLTAAWRLHRDHDITIFEAADRVGGHTHTVDVEWGSRSFAIDTGFIVFNDWTYPNFLALLTDIGVATRPSTMSFSVRCERTGLEWNGTSPDTLFAQRRNLLRPWFYGMLRDILRFNRQAPLLLSEASDRSLADYLDQHRYGRAFTTYYLVPMAAAIWSADPSRVLDMPAGFLIRFFMNHGMLSVDDRPQWRVVKGGSRTYVDKLTAPFRDRIRVATAVTAIKRLPSGIQVDLCTGDRERFDAVFIACHSDQALRVLRDPTPAEREVLGAIPYQANDVVLHTDTRLMPRRRRAWAAWNYHVHEAGIRGVTVTYNMNALQSLDAAVTFCVSLNRTDAIDPSQVLGRFVYEHPQFTPAAVAAQARHEELNGFRGTYYCGAYWGNGFHEDGVVSALTALRAFETRSTDAKLPLRRLG